MGKIVKKQHFVPQFYIRGFSIDNDREFCYEYNSFTCNICKKKISEICAHNYTYELRHEGRFLSEEDINLAEKAFSIIENSQARELKSLLAKIDNAKNYIILSDEEKMNLSSLMALMVLRNPIFKEVLPKAYDIVKKEMFDKSEQLRNFQFSNEREFEIVYIWRVAIAKYIEIIAKDFNNTQMMFIKAPFDKVFISSDIPFYFTGYPLSLDFYMPLNSNIAVCCEQPDNCVLKDLNKAIIKRASNDELKKYNQMIFAENGTTFASNEKILYELQHFDAIGFIRKEGLLHTLINKIDIEKLNL